METCKKSDIELFIFDLDGTVLGGHEPYKQFPPEFAKLLDELDTCGIKWATATTWPVDEQLQLIRSSGVKSNPVLLTGSTGRSAFSVTGNEMFPVTDYMKEVYELDYEFEKKYSQIIKNIVAELQASKCVEEISYNFFGHHVISFKAVDTRYKEVWRAFQPLLAQSAYYPFDPGNFKNNSLLPEYMNKARAVKIIQKIANISPEKTLLAGDETNDLHMFDSKLTKYMICPNNAHVEIKKAIMKNSGIVATKNYSYGIIEAVNDLLTIK